MMAMGNVGAALGEYAAADTFLTRDGGVTWTAVRKGPHLYDFGDRGAIVVMVNDKDPTRHLLYGGASEPPWVRRGLTLAPLAATRVCGVLLPGRGVRQLLVGRRRDVADVHVLRDGAAGAVAHHRPRLDFAVVPALR